MSAKPPRVPTAPPEASAGLGDEALTIVVPAWKPTFLRQALQSIAQQTDRSFDVQIFDDAAVPEVALICADFPEFRYTRFAENQGGQALVAHWNRCLAQVQTPWVWLFADDDVMAPDAVAAFRAARAAHPLCRVVQLPVDMVSEDLAHTLWSSRPPGWETAADFVAARLGQRRLSCLPDHIFHRPSLPHGLIDLPLAWNADDASWALLGLEHGLAGARGGLVRWRQSAHNVSNGSHRRSEKLAADLQFMAWLAAQPALAPTVRRMGARWLGSRLHRVYSYRGADMLALAQQGVALPWAAWFWYAAVRWRDGRLARQRTPGAAR